VNLILRRRQTRGALKRADLAYAGLADKTEAVILQPARCWQKPSFCIDPGYFMAT